MRTAAQPLTQINFQKSSLALYRSRRSFSSSIDRSATVSLLSSWSSVPCAIPRSRHLFAKAICGLGRLDKHSWIPARSRSISIRISANIYRDTAPLPALADSLSDVPQHLIWVCPRPITRSRNEEMSVAFPASVTSRLLAGGAPLRWFTVGLKHDEIHVIEAPSCNQERDHFWRHPGK